MDRTSGNSTDVAPAGTAGQPAGPTPLGPIVRRTLHDEVASRVRDLITEGRLTGGSRINEVALGLQLGVSRTPLREAIKTLAGEGLVELVPARGAVVRRFTRKDVADNLAVLKALEILAGRLACRDAPGEGIASVQALHAAMMERYAARDRLSYFKLNQAIHTAIVALSGNAALVWAHEAIQARMKRIRFIGNEGPEKWAGAVGEHEEMVEALRHRDGEALAEVLARHLDRTMERVQDKL